MNNRFYDLTFIQQADGSIRLTQSDHGDDYIIDLHPEQVLFIARQLCGMTSHTAEQVQELERRIAVLTDKVQNIVCNKAFRGDLIERLGDGFEYLAKLDGLLDLALEFDGGRLEPDNAQSLGDDDKPIYQPPAIAQVQKTPQRAAAEAGGQLGLAV